MDASDGETAIACTELVEALQHDKLRLVCIDFDLTLVRIHTHDKDYNVSQVASSMRPIFLHTIPKLLEAGLQVAIVTFNPETQLIRDVLDQCFPTSISNQIIIKGDDETWKVSETQAARFLPLWLAHGQHADRDHKLTFVIAAAIEASKHQDAHICNYDTALIDDDRMNIKCLHESGVRGIWFDTTSHDVAATFVADVRHLLLPKIDSVDVTDTSQTSTDNIMATPDKTNATEPVRRKKTWKLCTPSPVMKVKCTVDMGRPKSKRAMKLVRRQTRAKLLRPWQEE